MIVFTLYKFLASTNVLRWMEYLAGHGELQRIFHAGKTMLNWRRQNTPLLAINKEISVIERWGNDLIHLVTKFGKHMSLWPSSIHHLIPPFCPQDSALRRQFSSARGITAYGFSGVHWDDCVSVNNYYDERSRPAAVATSNQFFAVGMCKGNIMVYHHPTCQELQELENKEYAKCLAFGEPGQYLASSGQTTLRIWEVDSWTEILSFSLMDKVIALAFAEDDRVLLVATEANQFMSIDIFNSNVLREEVWMPDFEEHQHIRSRQPVAAVFSPHQCLLAIVYRGEDILLWDYEQLRSHATYEQDVGSRRYGSPKAGSTTVRSLAFSPAIDTNLLIAAYTDGFVVVYDTCDNVAIGNLGRINTRALSCSPDGRTLVAADTRGSIQLFDLETLKLIYRLRADGGASFAVSFTSDSHRIIDVRCQHCRVWEPAALLRQDIEDDENSDTISDSTVPHEVEYQMSTLVEITAVTVARSAMIAFCGKADGSVHVYDISSEPKSQRLLVQAAGLRILRLHFDPVKGILTSIDIARRVVCREVVKKPEAGATWEMRDPLITILAEPGVINVLTSGKHSLLLVSTNASDTLYQLPRTKNEPCLVQLQNSEERHWVQQESNPDQLVLITNSKVQIHVWDTLECLISVSLSTGLAAPFMTVDSVIPLPHSPFFATIAKDRSGSTSQTTTQIWDLRTITCDSSNSAPAPQIYNFGALSATIEIIIGVINSRLVFLNTAYWICSLDLEHPQELEGVVQHFFIPYNWLDSLHQSQLDLGPHGEIVFIRRAQMAVIKKGLQVTEKGTFTPSRRRSSGPKHGSLLLQGTTRRK